MSFWNANETTKVESYEIIRMVLNLHTVIRTIYVYLKIKSPQKKGGIEKNLIISLHAN